MKKFLIPMLCLIVLFLSACSTTEKQTTKSITSSESETTTESEELKYDYYDGMHYYKKVDAPVSIKDLHKIAEDSKQCDIYGIFMDNTFIPIRCGGTNFSHSDITYDKEYVEFNNTYTIKVNFYAGAVSNAIYTKVISSIDPNTPDSVLELLVENAAIPPTAAEIYERVS